MGCEDGDEIDCVSNHNSDLFHLCTVRMSLETLDDLWSKNQHEHDDNQYANWPMIQRLESHFLPYRSKQNSIHVNVVSAMYKKIIFRMTIP